MTGEELEEATIPDTRDLPQRAGDQEDVTAALQDRIIELELQLKRAESRQGPAAKGQPMVPASKAPPLFPDHSTPEMSTVAWARLQSLAGSPPPRVGTAETRRSLPTPALAAQDGLLAGMEKEAEEMEMSRLLRHVVDDPFVGCLIS